MLPGEHALEGMGELEGVGAAAGRSSGDRVRWFRKGKLPVPARRAKRPILVEPSGAGVVSGTVAVYACVSSADQRRDLTVRSPGLPCGRRVKDLRWGAW